MIPGHRRTEGSDPVKLFFATLNLELLESPRASGDLARQLVVEQGDDQRLVKLHMDCGSVDMSLLLPSERSLRDSSMEPSSVGMVPCSLLLWHPRLQDLTTTNLVGSLPVNPFDARWNNLTLVMSPICVGSDPDIEFDFMQIPHVACKLSQFCWKC